METPELGVIWLIITCVSILATIFGIRYLKNKENLSLIERGINPNADRTVPKARPKPFASLRIGMPLIGVGLGLLIASIVDLNIARRDVELTGIYFGLITMLGGLGFFLSYKIEMKWWIADEEAKKA
ncbi:MAG: hypothetical protein QM610_10250 [Chitinophagaceae bacterium]